MPRGGRAGIGGYPAAVDDSARLVLDVGLVLLLAAGAGWLARRIGLPAIVGYLAAGLAVSPFTPGYVADRDQITFLADVGVVLLLFEVGIEVDLGRIRREARSLLAVAPLQVLITTAVGWAAFGATGSPPLGAALLGLSVALSSSVVVVNITRSRRRTTDRETERALLGWSVVQDVAGVTTAAVMLAVFEVGGRSPVEALGGLALFALLTIGAAWLLPAVLRRLRSEHDLFLIVSVASGLTLAAVGSVAFGIPMALAAFVAGLAIGEGHDAAEARRRLLPFRDVFAVLFFVSLGSVLNPASLPSALPYLALALALVVLAKTLPIAILARLVHLPARPAQLALGLSQVGEFGFVLASVGVAADVVSPERFTAVVATVVVTTAGSAVLARLTPGPRSPEPTEPTGGREPTDPPEPTDGPEPRDATAADAPAPADA